MLLADQGVLLESDRPTLTAYVQAWAQWQEAEAILTRDGLVLQLPIMNRHGDQVGTRAVKNPAINIGKDARTACMRAAALFGFSPLDREKITATPPAPTEPDPWDDI